MNNPNKIFDELNKSIQSLKSQHEKSIYAQMQNPIISADTIEGRVLRLYKEKMSVGHLQSSNLSSVFEKIKGYTVDYSSAVLVLKSETTGDIDSRIDKCVKEKIYDIEFFKKVIETLEHG